MSAKTVTSVLTTALLGLALAVTAANGTGSVPAGQSADTVIASGQSASDTPATALSDLGWS